jgi:hypothetical protein
VCCVGSARWCCAVLSHAAGSQRQQMPAEGMSAVRRAQGPVLHCVVISNNNARAPATRNRIQPRPGPRRGHWAHWAAPGGRPAPAPPCPLPLVPRSTSTSTSTTSYQHQAPAPLTLTRAPWRVCYALFGIYSRAERGAACQAACFASCFVLPLIACYALCWTSGLWALASEVRSP